MGVLRKRVHLLLLPGLVAMVCLPTQSPERTPLVPMYPTKSQARSALFPVNGSKHCRAVRFQCPRTNLLCSPLSSIAARFDAVLYVSHRIPGTKRPAPREWIKPLLRASIKCPRNSPTPFPADVLSCIEARFDAVPNGRRSHLQTFIMCTLDFNQN